MYTLSKFQATRLLDKCFGENSSNLRVLIGCIVCFYLTDLEITVVHRTLTDSEPVLSDGIFFPSGTMTGDEL